MSGLHVLQKLLPLSANAIFARKPLVACALRSPVNFFLVCRNFSSENMSKPQVFFDIAADKTPLGRIVMEVNVYF